MPPVSPHLQQLFQLQETFYEMVGLVCRPCCYCHNGCGRIPHQFDSVGASPQVRRTPSDQVTLSNPFCGFKMVNQASVEDAFRTPVTAPAKEIENSIRKQVESGRPLEIELSRQNGFTQWMEWFFFSRRLLKISGLFDVVLEVSPSGLKVDGKVLKSSPSWGPHADTTISVLDLMGNHPMHLLRVRTALPFLHPFVSLHLEVRLDGEVLYAEGKFAQVASE